MRGTVQWLRFTEKPISYARFRLELAVTVAVVASLASGQTVTSPTSHRASGTQIFASACASCHGLDGRGGERAPDIAQARAVQQLSNQQLTRILSAGIPGTGMPSFRSL